MQPAHPIDSLPDEAIAAIMLSPAEWAKVCVLIENKDHELQDWQPNILQTRISAAYETCQTLAIPTRILVLKPRQSGGSTMSAAVVIHHCLQYQANAVVMADDYGNSDNLYNIAKRHCQTDAFPWGVTTTFERKEINFSNGSRIQQDTANNPKAGISSTRQVVHLSEVCKYPTDGVRDSYTTISNMMAALNKTSKNSVAILESTPDTPAGFFYDSYQNAVTIEDFVDGKTGNGWIKVFAAWHEFPEHSREVSDGQKADIEATLTAREKRGQTRYDWTLEQIAWRRFILHSDCGGDERMFDVHYPEDEETCWLSSGRPRFDLDGMLALEKLAKLQMVGEQGWLTMPDAGAQSKPSWRIQTEGGMVLYEQPKEGCRYLVVVDPATGQAFTRGANPDKHGIFVLRAGYQNEHGDEFPIKVVMGTAPDCRWDMDRVAEAVIAMSAHYGQCTVVVERNMGHDLIGRLTQAGIPLYRERVIDRITSKLKDIYGWQTDKENRVRCIERLASLVRDSTMQRPLVLPPQDCVAEMRTFVIDKSGKAEAAAGKHDDLVMALAIGVATIDSATEYRRVVRRAVSPSKREGWT